MKKYKCDNCGGFHITTMKPRKKWMGNSDKQKYKADYSNVKPDTNVYPKGKPSKNGQKSLPLTTYRPFEYFRKNIELK